MISDHIKDIITAVKALPNSLERNKTVSHLEDARVWMHSIEFKEGNRYGVPPTQRKDLEAEDLGLRCSCPEGAVDSHCPIHGLVSV